jgi:LuxR family maltose regulon positive regulatory protein
VPADRHGRFQVLLAVLRLSVCRRQGNLPTVAEETDRLLAEVEAPGAAQLGLGADLRALALISLGIAEAFAARLEDADRHLDQGVALARRIGRPYLELLGLAHGAVAGNFRSYAVGAQRSRQAIELAQQHGWSEDQAAGVAYVILGGALVGQGRLAEAAPWLERAEQTLRVEAEPAAGMLLHYGRGLLELAGGGYREALADFQAAEQLADTLVTPHTLATRMRAHMLETLVRLGRTDGVEAALAGLDSREREGAEMRAVLAALRLAQQDALAATTALAPVIDGSVGGHPRWVTAGVLLEAIARDALGDQAAAGRALERALALAAPGSVLLPFLLHPAPGLLERHARQGTAHAALITEILGLLPRSGGRGSTDSLPARTAPGGYGGTDSPPMRRGPGEYGGMASPHERGGLGGSTPRLALREPLSEAETRVLRYLPTSLTVPEIANQLCLSANTIRTHMRHIYDKLDVHRRHEAVEGARTLGLLAPTAREPSAASYPVHHIRGR